MNNSNPCCWWQSLRCSAQCGDIHGGTEYEDISLSAKQRSIIAIAAFTAGGDMEKLKICID